MLTCHQKAAKIKEGFIIEEIKEVEVEIEVEEVKEKKNDPKQNLLRQTKYFDHSKYHDVPNANDIPMDLFD